MQDICRSDRRYDKPAYLDADCTRRHQIQTVQPYQSILPARCLSTREWVDISVSCVFSLLFKWGH